MLSLISVIDLSHYLDMLEETNANLIVFRGDEIIFSSYKRGVSPLIEVIEIIGLEKLKGVVTSDRIVGKAAVLLNAYMGVSKMYALVMSKEAMRYANKFNLPYIQRETVENILNREGNGICPFEQLVSKIYDPEEAYKAIKAKLESFQ